MLASTLPLIDSEMVVTNESDRTWPPTTDCRCHQSWISDLFSKSSANRIPKLCRTKELTKRKVCDTLRICDECYNRIRALARNLYAKYNLDKEPSLVRKRCGSHSNAIISVCLQIWYSNCVVWISIYILKQEDGWLSECLYYNINVQQKKDQKKGANKLSQSNQVPRSLRPHAS